MNRYIIGSIWKNNEGYDCKIISKSQKTGYYIIEFIDEFKHRKEVCGKEIGKGLFTNPYHRKAYGVGYRGFGEYKSVNHKRYYQKWKDMIRRCYSEYRVKNISSYEDCIVCDEWHNFQNFAKWLDDNNWNGFDVIDKDLLVEGNKTYSPETCCLIPSRLNSQLIFFNRKCYDFNKNKFRVRVNEKHIGLYENENDAIEASIIAKKNRINEIIEEWKDKLDIKIINKLKERGDI